MFGTLMFRVTATLLLVGCHAFPTWKELDEQYSFEHYVVDFRKSYDSLEEYGLRKQIFERHLNQILEHNRKRTVGHVMGVNHLTDQEPNELPLGYDKSGRHGWSGSDDALVSSVHRQLGSHQMDLPFDIDDVSTLPSSVDWRERGVVSPVKDQGGCGSCWAFASAAALESHIAVETETLFSLSTQELVSCVTNPRHCGGGGGCSGATAELAFDFVATEGNGIVQEWQMGYGSYHGEHVNCSIIEDGPQLLRGQGGPDPPGIRGAVATIDGYSVLPSNDYAALMNAVAKKGPLVVSVAANSWFLYEKGVFSDQDKSPNACDLNHAVVLVGYGTDEETNEDYWLIRNSWRPTWGKFRKCVLN